MFCWLLFCWLPLCWLLFWWLLCGWLLFCWLLVCWLLFWRSIAISMIAILLTGFSTVSVQLGFCCCLSALVPLVVSCSHTGVPHITRASALLLVLSLCAVSVFGSCCYQGVFLPSWLLVAIQSLSWVYQFHLLLNQFFFCSSAYWTKKRTWG